MVIYENDLSINETIWVTYSYTRDGVPLIPRNFKLTT